MLEEHREAAALQVVRGSGGRAQRRLDLAHRHAVREVARTDEGHPEASERERLAAADDPHPLLGEPQAPADVRGGLRAHQQRTRALRHLGRIHGVVVVRVHHDHGGEPLDAGTEERTPDRLRVRLDPRDERAQETGPAEEAVGQDRGLAVVEEHRGDPEEGHAQGAAAVRARGGQHALGMAIEVRPVVQDPRHARGDEREQRHRDPESDAKSAASGRRGRAGLPGLTGPPGLPHRCRPAARPARRPNQVASPRDRPLL